MGNDHPGLRERDLLRDAIARHKDSHRPCQRRPHDEELYAALAAAGLSPDAAAHLRRQQEYYESPYNAY